MPAESDEEDRAEARANARGRRNLLLATCAVSVGAVLAACGPFGLCPPAQAWSGLLMVTTGYGYLIHAVLGDLMDEPPASETDASPARPSGRRLTRVAGAWLRPDRTTSVRDRWLRALALFAAALTITPPTAVIAVTLPQVGMPRAGIVGPAVLAVGALPAVAAVAAYLSAMAASASAAASPRDRAPIVALALVSAGFPVYAAFRFVAYAKAAAGW